MKRIVLALLLTASSNFVHAVEMQFCAFFKDGRPASTGCEDSLDDCLRMSHADRETNIICVAVPKSN